MRVRQHASHRPGPHDTVSTESVKSSGLSAALVADAWALGDVARALGMWCDADHASIAQATPFNVSQGTVVGLRPIGSKIHPSWRQSIEAAGLSPSDRAVDGGESIARRLTHQEVIARAAAFATTPGVDVVVIAGVTDFVDGIASVCRAYGRLLAVADHHRTAVRAFGAAADFIIELDTQCFPRQQPGPRASRYVEVAQ